MNGVSSAVGDTVAVKPQRGKDAGLRLPGARKMRLHE
jgi:hypothetical protein